MNFRMQLLARLFPGAGQTAFNTQGYVANHPWGMSISISKPLDPHTF
jgi:hypothetical protein